jgi:hypothetical protein
MRFTEQEVARLYEEAEQKNKECLLKSEHGGNDCYSQYRVAQAILDIQDLISEVHVYEPGIIIINNKYIYSCKTGKWRINGRDKWYYSKNIFHFIDNYVNDKTEEFKNKAIDYQKEKEEKRELAKQKNKEREEKFGHIENKLSLEMVDLQKRREKEKLDMADKLMFTISHIKKTFKIDYSSGSLAYVLKKNNAKREFGEENGLYFYDTVEVINVLNKIEQTKQQTIKETT